MSNTILPLLRIDNLLPGARAITTLVAVLLTGFVPGNAGLPGFRGDKKMVIKRLLPPAVNLTHKRIGVLSEAQGGVNPEIAKVLKTRVVTAIQRDPNFIIDEAHAETHLSFKITTFRVEEVRTVGAGNPPATCISHTGRADVSYQAIEAKTGIPQDSENLSWTIGAREPASDGSMGSMFRRSVSPCGTPGKASDGEAMDDLYEHLVQQVTQRAAPVDEAVEVWIPGGKVKDLQSMAMQNRWAALIEKAEQTPKMERPEDEADRLYLIALGHEALAYDARREAWDLERRRTTGQSGDNSRDAQEKEATLFNTAKGHLEQAAQFYRDAIGSDSKRNDLKTPEGRIEYAVRLYATIERQRNEYVASLQKQGEERSRKIPAPAPTPDPSLSSRGSKTDGTKPAAAGGSNEEVLKLCEEKLDEGSILDFIKSPDAHTFDLSVKGLVDLKHACGDSTGKYIAAMRAKTRPKPVSSTPKPAVVTAK